MARKRVSLKGKGAEIFFGDYAEQPAAVSDTPNELSAPSPAALDQVPQPQLSKQARMHASKHASMQEKKVTPLAGEVTFPADLREMLWRHLSVRATLTNAFRYTDQELALLTDVLYDIQKKHGVKLSKQDVARLGLNAILLDYEQRGPDSLLGEFITRRKETTG